MVGTVETDEAADAAVTVDDVEATDRNDALEPGRGVESFSSSSSSVSNVDSCVACCRASLAGCRDAVVEDSVLGLDLHPKMDDIRLPATVGVVSAGALVCSPQQPDSKRDNTVAAAALLRVIGVSHSCLASPRMGAAHLGSSLKQQ